MAQQESQVLSGSSPQEVPMEKRIAHKKNVFKIAVFQKGVLLCFIAMLILLSVTNMKELFSSPLALTSIVAFGIELIASVLIIILAFNLNKRAMAIVLSVLSFVPYINLAILLLVNMQATKKLQRNGVRVGFLGASFMKLRQMKSDYYK